MKHRRPALVIFDWNGTKVLDLHAAHEASCAILRMCGIETPLDHDTHFRSVARRGNWHDVFAEHNVTLSKDEIIERYIKTYLEHAVGLPLRENAASLIEQLHMSSVHVRILTAAREQLAVPVMEACGLFELIPKEHMLFHVEDKVAGMQHLIRELRVAPKDVCAVGDMPSDARAAASAGIRPIAIANPCIPRDVFEDVRELHYFALDFYGVEAAIY